MHDLEWLLLAKVVAAYLLGGIMGGDVMRQVLGGEDLRALGSRNVGASNALRHYGWKFALGVLLVDFLKGALAVLVLGHLDLSPTFAEGATVPGGAYDIAFHAAGLSGHLVTGPLSPWVCGFAAILGHCYPAFAGLRGGRGVATAAGAALALMPAASPWMLAVFAGTLMLLGYASLASLAGALSLVLWVASESPQGLLSSAGVFAMGITLLLTFKHRENLQRLRHHQERRFERVRVLGRALETVVGRWLAPGVTRIVERMAGAWRAG